MNPKYFRKIIEDKYQSARDRKISRMSMEWSIWSAEMNRELRKYTEKSSNTQILYKYVFIYWILLSQLLELKFRGGFINKIKARAKINEINEVKKVLDLKVKPKSMKEEDIMEMMTSLT